MRTVLSSVCAALFALGLGAVSARAEYTPENTFNFDTGTWGHEDEGTRTVRGATWSEDDNEQRLETRRKPKQRAAKRPASSKQQRAGKRRMTRQARAAGRPGRTAAPMRSLTGGGSQSSGVASYYWQPQRVASGGLFNPNAMTAAHKTLPFGTRVRVTHAGTGRSVNVTINDRGPFVAGRVIDLSSAAAGVLGMKGAGLAKVVLDVLGR